jgi:hypothetical protein
MIGRAGQTIDIMTRDAITLPTTLAELEEVTENGIMIRILTNIDSNALKEYGKIVNPNIEIAENSVVNDIILLTIDGKEALMNIPYRGGQKRTVWSNINAYVETKLLIFKDYWDLGHPIQERLQQAAKRDKVEKVTQMIKKGLEDGNWTVEAPGMIAGISWKTYMFDIVAKRPKKNEANLCIDILTEGSVFNKIVERSTLNSDLESSRFLLASLILCKPEELKLAELYQIKIVYSENEENLVSNILDTIKQMKNGR